MAEGEEDLSKRLATVLDEIREVMEKRKERIEALRQEITDIERDNEELEKPSQTCSIPSIRRLSYPELALRRVAVHPRQQPDPE